MTKFTLALTFFICSFSIHSQEEITTTYEEYNYLTELYPNQDIKELPSGYKLEKFDTFTFDKYTYDFEKYINTESNAVKAVLVTVTKTKRGDDKLNYMCIPFNNGKLMQQYVSSQTSIGIQASVYYGTLVQSMFTKLLSKQLNP